MKYVEIVSESGSIDTIRAIADKESVFDMRVGPVCEDGMRQIRLLVKDDGLQWVLDALQNILGAQPTARVTVMPVEATLPRPEQSETTAGSSRAQAREELYQSVAGNASITSNYLLLVFFSTIVAAIGLIENNVAIVIGAMVIAPLLGPNLALSLGTALGDVPLMWKSLGTLMVGVVLAVVLSMLLGFVWPGAMDSPELLARTDAGLDSIALALASGAAAALSLSTGLSSVLVGVMVAVALLPPAATLGLMLGQGQAQLALGAGILLAINVVSVNLASKAVFYFKGVSPRTWHEQEKARLSMKIYMLVWVLTLLALVLVLYLRESI